MVLNLSVIDCVLCVCFVIFTWHEGDRGIISTRGFQLVRKCMGTDRYIPIVRLEYIAVCSLYDIAIN